MLCPARGAKFKYNYVYLNCKGGRGSNTVTEVENANDDGGVVSNNSRGLWSEEQDMLFR